MHVNLLLTFVNVRLCDEQTDGHAITIIRYGKIIDYYKYFFY